MAKLVIKLDNKLVREHEITGNLIIGRESGDIILRNPAVSAKHAELRVEDGRYVLQDLKSTNGTFVNKGRISTQEIHHGDVISIGKFKIEFINTEESLSASGGFGDDAAGMTVMIKAEDLLGSPAAGEGQKDKKEKTSPAGIKPEAREARLVLVPKTAGQSGRMVVYKLKKDTMLIGSGSNVDIRIKGITVGNVAAAVSRENDFWKIKYIGGFGKIKVNDKKISTEVRLKAKDRIDIGSYTFEFLE